MCKFIESAKSMNMLLLTAQVNLAGTSFQDMWITCDK